MTKLQHILLVEDDADIRAIVTLSLTAFGGYQVTSAADVVSAIAAATSTPPDLVLLDFMMPGMDGLQTLAELRKLDGGMSTLPAIFVTAAVATQQIADIQDPHVLGVIAKPFDAVGLAGEIQSLWDNRL